MDRALITGITGQDGSYLAEFLLSKGVEVHGLIRRASTFNTSRIEHLYRDPHDTGVRLFLHYGDLSNSEQLTHLIYNVMPQQIYHLGAQSHVRVSFDMPEYTGDVTGLGTTRLLNAIQMSGIKTRFYQASSSEMFGNSPPPQTEVTRFQPRSPYAAAKVYAYWMVVNYRIGYNQYASNGILFNHESPRRGETFVTRKVTQAVARILAGSQDKLYLGNLDSRRDWGYAPEYIEAMWAMMNQDSSDDFVVGTGETHSVEEFVSEAFAYADLDWRQYVEFDERYFRPTEVDQLRADASKARDILKWEPRVGFRELVSIMVDSDMQAFDLDPIGRGRQFVEEHFDGWHQWDSSVTSVLANAKLASMN